MFLTFPKNCYIILTSAVNRRSLYIISNLSVSINKQIRKGSSVTLESLWLCKSGFFRATYEASASWFFLILVFSSAFKIHFRKMKGGITIIQKGSHNSLFLNLFLVLHSIIAFWYKSYRHFKLYQTGNSIIPCLFCNHRYSLHFAFVTMDHTLELWT